MLSTTSPLQQIPSCIVEIYSKQTGQVIITTRGQLVFMEDILEGVQIEQITKKYNFFKGYAGLPPIGRILPALSFVLGLDEENFTVISDGIPKGGIVRDQGIVE